ncbi:MAG: WD40/YVTN/BNR-like repeat-containing protein [Verrucomicrobiales bacterium]
MKTQMLCSGWGRRYPGWVAILSALAGLWLPGRGQTWHRMESGTPNDLTAAHFADARHGYVCGTFGTLLRTVDGGVTWTRVPTPVNASFVSVAAKSAEEVLIGRVGLYRTKDAGGQWDRDVGGYDSFSGSIFDILFTSENEGVFTKGGGIFATSDGGDQWGLVLGTELFLDDLQRAGEDVLFATGGISYSEIFGFTSRGDMARSRDGGLSWEALVQPDLNEIHASVWFDHQSGIVFTFTNKAHRTRDQGDTWELVSDEMRDAEGNPLPAIIMDAALDSANKIVAVDFAGNFLESSDGSVWQVRRGSGEPMVAMTALPDGSLIAVGNAGHIWKRSAPPPASPISPLVTGIAYDYAKRIVTLQAVGTPGRAYRVAISPDLVGWEGGQSHLARESEFSIVVEVPRDVTSTYYRLEELAEPVRE